MEVKLKVKRFDPETDNAPSYKSYVVDVPESSTVLDALIEVREYHDGTLSLRCSCRSSICGSCAMRVDGGARLACKTQLRSVAPDGHELVIEPAGNLPVIKDLVVDMAPFWDKIREVEPWLQPAGPPPEGEYVVPHQTMVEVAEVMNCIMCGACVSDCTVLEVDQRFLGPAALAKGWRFIGDPRDAANGSRLGEYSKPSGIWDCTRCNFCVQVCPKDVKPMDQIMKLRSAAIDLGITNNFGSRHSTAFTQLVQQSGRLDEFRLPVFTHGRFNLIGQMSDIPVGLRMIRAGKMPSPFHGKIPGIRHVRRLMKRFAQAGSKES